MNVIAAIAVLGVVFVALVIWGVKAAQRGGEKRGRSDERADQLEENARRRKQAERASAKPLPIGPQLRAAARRYRERRMRDSEGR